MTRPQTKWLLAAFALVALAPGAQAVEKKHHRHVAAHHAPKFVSNTRSDYLDVGAVPDAGADQRYFNDTKGPNYYLGPAIFQRFN